MTDRLLPRRAAGRRDVPTGEADRRQLLADRDRRLSLDHPAGDSFSLPVGISFIGTGYSEPKLIKVASGFESATKARKKPSFLPALPDENPGFRSQGGKPKLPPARNPVGGLH